MTSEELTNALAKLNEIETEASSLREVVHESIAKARAINAAVRVFQDKLHDLDSQSVKIRAALKLHRAEEESANQQEKPAAGG